MFCSYVNKPKNKSKNSGQTFTLFSGPPGGPRCKPYIQKPFLHIQGGIWVFQGGTQSMFWIGRATDQKVPVLFDIHMGGKKLWIL